MLLLPNTVKVLNDLCYLFRGRILFVCAGSVHGNDIFFYITVNAYLNLAKTVARDAESCQSVAESSKTVEESCEAVAESCKTVAMSCKNVVKSCKTLAESYKTVGTQHKETKAQSTIEI